MFNEPAAMIRPRRLPDHACWTGSVAGSTDPLPEDPRGGSRQIPVVLSDFCILVQARCDLSPPTFGQET